MDIKADMKIVDKGSLLAVGSVTIDSMFTIKNVKALVLGKDEQGKDRTGVYLPRKKMQDGRWQDLFTVDWETKKQIDLAVGENLKEILGNNTRDHEAEVSVRLYQKGDLLGYASVNYESAVRIDNIRIYRGKDGEGIRLVYPYSVENGETKDLMDFPDPFFADWIQEKVQEAYTAESKKSRDNIKKGRERI